ncbi:MAG: pyrimidine/purine nucleoside phosphorylase [Gammaproteobacteria bacterium]|nr:pyrimidine/purine nucleoside phosphorylase [Gammaproteobacteria bacterium]
MLKVNEYFDGKVKSIGFNTDTLPATVGVMVPGDYVFNTGDKEKMTVVSGALSIKLPGEDDFTTYNAGESFDVAANCAFDVKVEAETAYLCLYG